MGKDRTSKPQVVGSGYASFQIAKALLTKDIHDDPDVRARADAKVQKWLKVIGGMEAGEIAVGSRTPVSETPAWATLEVVTGGFATGELLAGGEIRVHERQVIDRIAPGTDDGRVRETLNAYFISEEGVAELFAMLENSCYQIGVPEEGALLMVACLLRGGHTQFAREIIEEIAGYFSRLRFYPAPTETPRLPGAFVHLESVEQVSHRLSMLPENQAILAQKEAIEIWAPMLDQFVSLFLDTFDGEAPTLEQGSNSGGGRGVPIGGSPCQKIPDGWIERAQGLLSDFDRLRAIYELCGKPSHKNGSFAQLRSLASKCVESNGTLSERDLARLRLVIAGCVTKRGIPGTASHQELRESQRGHGAAPTFQEIAKSVILRRLEPFPKDSGLDEIESLVAPVTGEESASTAIPAGKAIPTTLRQKVERALERSLDRLIELGIVTSGDTLARLLPQITSTLRAQNISDPCLRVLYSAVYRAFRERRSLLLLNLEKQVQIEELPWVAGIDKFREKSISAKEASHRALEEVVALTLSSFPYAILPNKLLQEMRALAKGGDAELPLVDEIAADIFMGAFSQKFTAAAKIAADLLEDSLYARYYGIDFSQVRALHQPKLKKSKKILGWGRPQATGDKLAAICAKRAGVKLGGWDVVSNGMTIEQQQIMTTQNLAVAFCKLDLKIALSGQLEDMAWRCLTWICRRHTMKIDGHHARLTMLKNTAYAWRQMVFYLSVTPGSETATIELIGRARGELEGKFGETLRRLEPALQGLESAAKGSDIPNNQRFLGWTKGGHWLLQGRADSEARRP